MYKNSSSSAIPFEYSLITRAYEYALKSFQSTLKLQFRSSQNNTHQKNSQENKYIVTRFNNLFKIRHLSSTTQPSTNSSSFNQQLEQLIYDERSFFKSTTFPLQSARAVAFRSSIIGSSR